MAISELRSSPTLSGTRFTACFTADVEQDCPPYLRTCRGMTEGMPRFLDLLAETAVRGTFFTTGEMARRFPEIIARVVREGHELGCHGDLHRDFTTLNETEAEGELRESLATLRTFGPVVSFRAPYLRFPTEYLALLTDLGLQIDSSIARYKVGRNHRGGSDKGGGPLSARLRPPDSPRTDSTPTRIPASVTSSVLRLPALIRRPWLAALRSPLVLFIHPWEAVDFRASSLRWDCRFRTGPTAVQLWRDTITDLKQQGADFQPMNALLPVAA